AFPAYAPPEERGKLLYTRAGYYQAGESHDAARRDLEQAIFLARGYFPAILALARQNLLGLPRHRDAIWAYNLLPFVGSQAEATGDVVTLLGIAELQLQRHREGVALLERPGATSVGGFRELYLALAYHHLGRRDDADAALRAAGAGPPASLNSPERDEW